MRCKACDTILNDFDLKRKDRDTGEFLDLCGTCYLHSEQAVITQDERAQYIPGLSDMDKLGG